MKEDDPVNESDLKSLKNKILTYLEEDVTLKTFFFPFFSSNLFLLFRYR